MKSRTVKLREGPDVTVLVRLKRLGRSEYEFEHGPLDFYIRYEPGAKAWAAEHFLSEEEDADSAHLRTVEHETLEDAVRECLAESNHAKHQ